MRFRPISILALAATLALAACGGDAASPTATSGTQQATVTTISATQSPSEVVSSPTQPSQAEAPTAIGAPASAAKEPLTLNPVPVQTTDSTRTGVFETERTLNLPAGFQVNVYATGLDKVRLLELSPDGLLYATIMDEGRVVTLPDRDKDGVADETRTFADNLPGVHGIAFREGAVYVATETDIIRLQDTDGDGVADKRDTLANDLPSGGGHSSRTLAFGPDGKLYVSAGSSCNVCEETDPKRAAISRYSTDGKFEKVYAEGLRNAVGLVFHPVTGELWASNNGRDQLGDDVPPETIYNVKEDTHYGWPYCYGSRQPDPDVRPAAGFCERTGTPAVEMQAHSAPLGLHFYTGDNFPAQLKGDMFVAFHGSWNRTVPTGYKLVRVRMSNNVLDKEAGNLVIEDFATGWHIGDDSWGRPVAPITAPDGSLLLTDDKAGAILRIYYEVNSGP